MLLNSSDAGLFTKFVTAIQTRSGGDLAEDVMGGLKVALHELTWRPEACKVQYYSIVLSIKM